MGLGFRVMVQLGYPKPYTLNFGQLLSRTTETQFWQPLTSNMNDKKGWGERERERDVCVCIYIHISTLRYVCTHSLERL